MRASSTGLLVLALAAGAVAWLRFSGEHGAPAAEPAPEPPRPSASPFEGRRPLDVATADLADDPDAPARGAGPDAEAIARNNEAAELLEAGDAARAVALLEELLAEHPATEAFRQNLAEARVRHALADYEARRLEEALAGVVRALELHPARPDADGLRELERRWRAELALEEDHWSEGSSLFELSYSAERGDILHHSQAVLDHLERVYAELAGWFAADPVRRGGRARIRVVLYRRDAFGELTGLGDWAGGAFDGVVRIAVEDLLGEEARWRRVLRHELVHVFVDAVGGRDVPGWLNEGLAQLLETDAPDLASAEARLGGDLFPLERLRASLASWDDDEAIARAYAQSLLVVERVRREYGAEALRRMVAGCATGVDPAASFEAYTQVPLDFVVGLLRGGG